MGLEAQHSVGENVLGTIRKEPHNYVSVDFWMVFKLSREFVL